MTPSPSPTPQDEVLTDERKAARYDDLEGYLRRRCLEFGLSPEGDYADVACRLRDHMADLTGDLADAKADCLRLHKQFVDAKYPDHRSSPSSAVPDVVREWEENRDPYALSEKHEASLNWAHAKQMATGDRMAAALTAQAKTIETGLMLIHSLAGERDAERATVTELRAELAAEREKFLMHTAEVGAWLSTLADVFGVKVEKVSDACSQIFDAAKAQAAEVRGRRNDPGLYNHGAC